MLNNPLIIMAIVVAAVLPIFNGKTILQILLDLLIPKPPSPANQAWQHYTKLAEQALAEGDAIKARTLAARAADEAAKYQEQQLQFEPGTIIQWILKLVTGGAGGGMLPLILIGAVIFLTMGGCPKEIEPLQPLSTEAAELEAPTAWTERAESLMFVNYVGDSIPIDPEPDLAESAADCPPCTQASSSSAAKSVVSSRSYYRAGPIRRLLAARPIRSFLASRPLKRLLCRR